MVKVPDGENVRKAREEYHKARQLVALRKKGLDDATGAQKAVRAAGRAAAQAELRAVGRTGKAAQLMQ
jgi:hypothetical protein